MRCLRIKCIETFPIKKIYFLKINITLLSFINSFLIEKLMFKLNEFFYHLYMFSHVHTWGYHIFSGSIRKCTLAA
jgi:hypothetical protein